MNVDDHNILPFVPDEGNITRLYRRSLRLGHRMLRLAEAILANPDADAATLAVVLDSIDRMLLAERQLRVWAAEEQQELRDRRRAARVN